MSETKIAYTRKFLRVILLQGLVWFLFFVANLFFTEQKDWIAYAWLALSLWYFGNYWYCTTQKYLVLTENYIRTNGLFGRRIAWDEVVRIKYFAGDLILKTTGGKDLIINTQIIDPGSLDLLKEKLQRFEPKPLTV
ncbi:hypothetical protein [Robiginitalea myxolifaciens]|nr:hypothetical protein [Robiginitalea myxolifaciens]